MPYRSGIIIAGLAKIRNMISFGSGQLPFTFVNKSGWDNEEIPPFITAQGEVKLLVGTFFAMFFVFLLKDSLN